MKGYNENKESSYIMYWDTNNLCGQKISQKLTVNIFIWEKNISKFNKSFRGGFRVSQVSRDD